MVKIWQEVEMLILDKLDQKHFDEGLTMSLNPEFAKFAAATSEKKRGGVSASTEADHMP